jgi:hypothetical protein
MHIHSNVKGVLTVHNTIGSASPVLSNSFAQTVLGAKNTIGGTTARYAYFVKMDLSVKTTTGHTTAFTEAIFMTNISKKIEV